MSDDFVGKIREYFDNKGFTQKMIAERLGVDPAYVNKLLSGKKPFGKKTAHQFQDLFGLSESWLLTGSGDMVYGDQQVIQVQPNRNGILVYDIDATCGKQSRDMDFTDDIVIGSIDLPNISRDCKIIRANGDSMIPTICDGNWIAIREVYDFDDVFYGQIYVVVTSEYRMIKYVRKYEQDEDHYFLLRSANPNYDDITMRKDKIRKLFIVENILSVKIQL